MCCRLAELVQMEMPCNPRTFCFAVRFLSVFIFYSIRLITVLELPPTHGPICPWDPPPYVPMNILQKLHYEIVNKLAQHAIARC